MPFSQILDLAPFPEQRMVLDGAPQVGHVDIVWVVSVS